jgi:N utilization substance protein A
MFEEEVPEIAEGIVEIKTVVREPGSRAKVAVYSYEPSVDPVGACVGMRGARVQNVVSELRGEKIDIIPWSEDVARFACNALAPAVVSRVYVDDNSRSMEIIVADDQLSLAIGKRGQNVRLAAKLVGWRIDIKTESSTTEGEEEATEFASFDGTVQEELEEPQQAEEGSGEVVQVEPEAGESALLEEETE